MSQVQFDVAGVYSYLSSKGIPYKKASGGSELVVTCPFCGKEDHFYVSVKPHKPGYYNCKVCGAYGTFRSLLRYFGDLPEIWSSDGTSRFGRSGKSVSIKSSKSVQPKNKPKAGVDIEYASLLFDAVEGRSQDKDALVCWEWLTQERRISPDILKIHNVGYMTLGSKEKGSDVLEYVECMTFPYYDQQGTLLNIKYRGVNNKKFMKRWPGCRSTLFGLELLDSSQSAVIICEGEFDAMALETYGYANVLSVPNGARGWDHTWNRELSEFETIFIAGDQDEDGLEGAKMMADKIGRFRCLYVELPYKDANACLQAGVTKEQMNQCFEKAEHFPGSEIVEVLDLEEELVAYLNGGVNTVGCTTGFTNLDLLIGGVRPQEVTVVTGDTGQGKTTFMSALSLNLATKAAENVLYMPFEMRPLSITARLLAMLAGKAFLEMSDQEARYWIQELSKSPISFLKARGAVGFEIIKEAILFAVRYLGVSKVFVDPLQYALAPASVSEERIMINEFMLMAQDLVEELYIHMFLVVHPTKLPGDKKGRIDRKVEMNDLPGSARIKQDADNVMRIWTKTDPQTGALSPDDVQVTFLKVRSEIGRTGTAYFRFNPESLQYEESEPPSVRKRRKKQQEQEEQDHEEEEGNND